MTIADELALTANTKLEQRLLLGLSEDIPWSKYINYIVRWLPSQLFLTGEQGVWYDPSDLSTLFKDAKGTQPVTTDGDPVGLMLDKSRGLQLGAELVVNGSFTSNVDNWTNTSGTTLSWENGKARLDFTNVGDAGIYQVINQPAGFCEVTTTVTRQYTGANAVSISLPGSGSGDVYLAQGETKTIKFVSYRDTAGAANLLIRTAVGVATGYFTVDEVSVGELKGNHATQTVSASRPTYQTDGILHWLQFDGVDDVLVASNVAWEGSAFMTNWAVIEKIMDYAGFNFSAAGTNYHLLEEYNGQSNETGRKAVIQRDPSTVTFYDSRNVKPVLGSPFVSWNSNGDTAKTGVIPTLSPLSVGVKNLASGNADLKIASGFSNNIGTIDFFGFVWLSRTPTVTERDDTNNYLAAKSGVTP